MRIGEHVRQSNSHPSRQVITPGGSVVDRYSGATGTVQNDSVDLVQREIVDSCCEFHACPMCPPKLLHEVDSSEDDAWPQGVCVKAFQLAIV